MTVTEQPNREDLHKAAELIQAAHDYIEVHGFSIMDYVPRGTDGAACYIGTLRMAAGVCGQPHDDDASLGDGPELGLALAELDRLAQSRVARLKREGYEEEDTIYDLDQDTGRMVEHLGFQLASKACDKYPEDPERQKRYQRDYALKLLRKALTTIYR